eukprot:g7035.t2
MEVVPQSIHPARADSDHNIVVATVHLGGRLAHNRPIRTSPKRQFNRQDLQRGTDSPAAALDKRPEARHGFKVSPNAATFRILKAACKGVKATIATSIYDHLERYVTKLEAVYQSRDMRGLCQHLKRSTGLGERQTGGQQFVTNENGILLRDKDAILKRWGRFFNTLLNSDPPTLNPDVVEQVAQRPTTRATRHLAAVTDPEEVEAAMRGLGNWKAVGPDLLAAELVKVDGDDEPIIREHLRAIFVEVWNGGEMPQEWKDATIKVLYKKGDRSNCNNFRGISLLSHVGKILAKTITNRLSAFCEANDILPEEQCGFRPGRSIVCMLFVVRRLQELGRRRRTPLYMCFIDLQKAYDSVDRELLWKLLALAGIPAEMIAVIRKFHVGMRARVCMDEESYRTGSRSSDWFLVIGLVPAAEGLARTMTIIVEVLREFGLTVSERKTETLVMWVKEKQPPLMPPPPLIIEAAGQRFLGANKATHNITPDTAIETKMGSPIPNDDNLLLITLVVTVVFQLAFFSVAFACKFDKVTDFAGGSNFIVLAILTLVLGGFYHARQIIVTAAVCIWGTRLAGWLLYRVIKMGKDDRFDDTRDNFFKFLAFWIFQMIWVWSVSLPLTFLNSTEVNPDLSARDIAGGIMFVVGFVFELGSDLQKDIFKSNGGRGVCETGLWKYSRHPNFFGDLMQWWGIFVVCSTVFGPAKDAGEADWGYATICGPLFLTAILLFGSGIPTVESAWTKKYGGSDAFWDYRERTSILFPLPPGLYKPLPQVVKAWLLLEWPFYQDGTREDFSRENYQEAPDTPSGQDDVPP